MDITRAQEQFKVVAVNLDVTEIAEADRIVTILTDAGWPRATRSFVVREALEHLREDLRGKSPDEIFRYFIRRRASRAAGPPPPSTTPSRLA